MTAIPLHVDATHDPYEALVEAREAEIEARTCDVCGRVTGDIIRGECSDCWLAADIEYERWSDK